MGSQLVSPALVLEQDKKWENDRPYAVEPYRQGRVIVNDRSLLDRYPSVNEAFKDRGWYGAYISPKYLKGSSPFISIAKDVLRTGDYVSAAIIGSLAIDMDQLKSISRIVQRDLAAIQLGPSRDYINALLRALKSDPTYVSHLRAMAKKQKIMICDPFGGGGVLVYFLADVLFKLIGDKFEIVIVDITDEGFTLTEPLLSAFGKSRFSMLKKHIKFIRGDGLQLGGIKRSYDLIVSTLALHEHSSEEIKEFFSICQLSLNEGGRLIVVDTTRERKILSRARRMLPALSRVGIGATAFKFLALRSHNISRDLFRSSFYESKWLSESGIRSYEAGYLVDELKSIAKKNEMDVTVTYDRTPPIGVLVFDYRKP